jgi:hypothetical protein
MPNPHQKTEREHRGRGECEILQAVTQHDLTLVRHCAHGLLSGKKPATDHLAFEVASVKANKSDGEAYKEQLGIKMVSRKGPSELFFIDHVEKPSEN